MPSPAAGVLTEILVAEGDTVAVGARSRSSATVATPPASPAPATPPRLSAPARPSPRRRPSRDSAPPPVADCGARDASGRLGDLPRRPQDPRRRRPRRSAGRRHRAGRHGDAARRRAGRAAAPCGRRGRPAEQGAAGGWPSTCPRRSRPSPQAFVAIEADATALARLASPRRHDASTASPSSPTTVVAVAVGPRPRRVRAAQRDDSTDEGLVVHHGVNLGVVLASTTACSSRSIHAAGGLTLRALARRVADLKERTATRQLTTDDLLGATFTIAGAPTEHVLFSVPILIQPQVAIVSVGAPRRALGRRRRTAASRARDRVVLGCSFDHRVVEATYVARFLERVGGAPRRARRGHRSADASASGCSAASPTARRSTCSARCSAPTTTTCSCSSTRRSTPRACGPTRRTSSSRATSSAHRSSRSIAAATSPSTAPARSSATRSSRRRPPRRGSRARGAARGRGHRGGHRRARRRRRRRRSGASKGIPACG